VATDTATQHKTADRRLVLRKLANALTLICMLATGLLILCYALGPKSGMEALTLIIPWMIAFVVNVLLVLPALFCALFSRYYLRNLWIFGYFAVFFLTHGAFFVSVNQIDVQLARYYHNLAHPGEMALNSDLRAMRFQAQSGRTPDAERMTRTKERIRSGVDVNRKIPGESRSALLYASTIGDPELVRLLLEHGARIDHSDNAATKLLHEAIRNGHPEVVAVLLEQGADPNRKDHSGQTPLMLAAESGDRKSLRHLLAAGADPSATHDSGSALARAVDVGDIDTVRLLLSAGADPALQTRSGKSLLYTAVEKDLHQIAALLKSAGAVEGKQTAETGRSADELYRALTRGDIHTLRQLLELGVPPDERDAEGRTLLARVCSKGYASLKPMPAFPVARLLVDSGADVNASDRRGRTPLINAAGSGALDLAALLVSSGAEVDAATTDGQTALMIAAGKGQKEIAALLLEAGANPNARAGREVGNDYPLSEAVASGDPELVQMLLDAGAVISEDRRDKGDLFQRGAGDPRIVRLLAIYGTDLNMPDNMNRYPLTQVLEYGRSDSARVLLALGAQPDIRANGGKHALVLASARGHADILPLIFERSERIRTDSRIQQQSLQAAIENGRTACVRYLLDRGVTGSLSEAESIMQRSRVLRKSPEMKEIIRSLFREKEKVAGLHMIP
jgi:ankyrin repeat protein